MTGGGTGHSGSPALVQGSQRPRVSCYRHHGKLLKQTHLCDEYVVPLHCHVCVCVCVQTRLNDQVVGYRDLAALPRDKAILQVERPDLMTYQPHLTFSPLDPPRREVPGHNTTAINTVNSRYRDSPDISRSVGSSRSRVTGDASLGFDQPDDI